MSCVTLQQRLEFLVKNNIVSIEVDHENRTVYFLSRRGESISKTFRLIKRLKMLQTAEKAVQGLQAISQFSDSAQEKTRRVW
jgi:RPA family protein